MNLDAAREAITNKICPYNINIEEFDGFFGDVMSKKKTIDENEFSALISKYEDEIF